MRIITVNLPQSYIRAMEKLVGILYPSRSELLRVAIREYLIREVEEAKHLQNFMMKVAPPKMKPIQTHEVDGKKYRLPPEMVLE